MVKSTVKEQNTSKAQKKLFGMPISKSTEKAIYITGAGLLGVGLGYLATDTFDIDWLKNYNKTEKVAEQTPMQELRTFLNDAGQADPISVTDTGYDASVTGAVKKFQKGFNDGDYGQGDLWLKVTGNFGENEVKAAGHVFNWYIKDSTATETDKTRVMDKLEKIATTYKK